MEVLLNAMTNRDVDGEIIGAIGVGLAPFNCKQLEKEWNNRMAFEITRYSKTEFACQNLLELFFILVLDGALNGQEAANFKVPLYTKETRRMGQVDNGWATGDGEKLEDGTLAPPTPLRHSKHIKVRENVHSVWMDGWMDG